MNKNAQSSPNNFHIIEHPLIKHKLSLLRDKNTSKKEFSELVTEITALLAYDATKSLPLTHKKIDTPLEPYEAPFLADKKPVILPILRAGLGMVDGFLQMMPAAKVGHIGMYRNEETHKPHRYYFKIPQHSTQRHFFVVDPMLATGGSAIDALDQIKQEGIKKITFVCIVASPKGMQALCKKHPDVEVFVASLDRELNEHAYILPGLGDAGDRLFGTI